MFTISFTLLFKTCYNREFTHPNFFYT